MKFTPILRRFIPKRTSSFEFSDIHASASTIACVDLGAFDRKIPRLAPIEAVVIMEDRLPQFFLEYKNYSPDLATSLNHHGPKKVLKTQADLKRLVVQLHEQGIGVFIGFWGQYRGALGESTFWIKRHPEVRPLDSRSSDMNPLVHLHGEAMNFADYVSMQYQKLARDFDFDGLFLGDGLNGYRIFTEPDAFRDKRTTIPMWNQFYRTVANGVHAAKGLLLAYDCMGFSPFEAILHGSDYKSQALAGLDFLVVQTYPYAWGEFWLRDKNGFDFASARDHLRRVKQSLLGAHTRVFYTLEVGDSVEGWHAPREHTLRQQEEFDTLSDGKMIVWGNEMIAKL